ncbi:hypothetical protein, partial [Parabacteroides sp.]
RCPSLYKVNHYPIYSKTAVIGFRISGSDCGSADLFFYKKNYKQLLVKELIDHQRRYKQMRTVFIPRRNASFMLLLVKKESNLCT